MCVIYNSWHHLLVVWPLRHQGMKWNLQLVEPTAADEHAIREEKPSDWLSENPLTMRGDTYGKILRQTVTRQEEIMILS